MPEARECVGVCEGVRAGSRSGRRATSVTGRPGETAVDMCSAVPVPFPLTAGPEALFVAAAAAGHRGDGLAAAAAAGSRSGDL